MRMEDKNIMQNNALVGDIRKIIEKGKQQAYASVNASMLATYWNVGRRIVEEEQQENQEPNMVCSC